MAKKINKDSSKNTKRKSSKHVNNPHDKIFKATFGMRSVIRGYLIDIFPKKFTDLLDLESLERESESYISKNLEETFSDLVWRCKLKTGRPILISFLFEHKSYKPKRPHLQIGEYQFGAYNIQNRTNPNEPLVQIVPIIVYHGQENWELIEPFESYFGEMESLFENFLPKFDFILTNIQSYSDNAIQTFQDRFLEKIFTAFKHYCDKTFIREHYAELWLSSYPNFENEETSFFIHAFGVYLSTIAGDISEEEIIIQLENISKNPLKSTDMLASERFLKSLEKKGAQEGRQETIINIYKETGWSAKKIAEITKFSEAYIQSIIDNFDKVKKS